MLNLSDMAPREGLEDRAARLQLKVNALVIAEQDCWPWQRRRRQLLSERKGQLVREVMDCYDMPPGGLALVPNGWV